MMALPRRSSFMALQSYNLSLGWRVQHCSAQLLGCRIVLASPGCLSASLLLALHQPGIASLTFIGPTSGKCQFPLQEGMSLQCRGGWQEGCSQELQVDACFPLRLAWSSAVVAGDPLCTGCLSPVDVAGGDSWASTAMGAGHGDVHTMLTAGVPQCCGWAGAGLW